jgi:DNA ligase 1
MPQVPNISGVLLPSFYFSGASVSDWWIGEKFDGIRAIWNPIKSSLFSKTGRDIKLNELVNHCMPRMFMDSEVWYGRNQFSETIRIIHSLSLEDINWTKFRLVVFDCPHNDSSTKKEGFEKRYAHLLDEVSSGHCFVFLETFLKCKGEKHALALTKNIWKSNGEGSILREPGSLYEAGRTRSVYKLKVILLLSLCIIVDYICADSA